MADRILRAEISLSSYIIASSSALFGLIVLATTLITDTLDENPFVAGLFIGVLPWSAFLLAGSISVLVGLARRSARLIEIGSITSFVMWIFAGISFGSQGNIDTVLVVVIPDMVYFGYLYLAASLKTFDKIKSSRKDRAYDA